jgi:putative transposase
MTKKNAKRRRHSTEFKAEAVRLVESRGDRTVGEIAQSLGVAESLLHIWKKQAEVSGSATRDRGESVDQELARLRSENADLKRDRDALVKSIAVFGEGPEVSSFEIIRAEAANFPVTVLCKLLEVSKSGYYAHLARTASARQQKDERVVTKVRAIHAQTRGVYGSRRMAHELDEPIGRNHLARLMRENGLLARSPRRFRVTTDSAHALPVASNLLEQDFDVAEPNRV